MPRSAVTPVLGAAATADGKLLLPSQELPVWFGLLWEEQIAAASAPDEGHLTTDSNGDLLLCLLSRQINRVTALRLPHPAAVGTRDARRVEVAFSLSAVSVAAVAATRGGRQQGSHGVGPRDLLLLHPDGRLALYVGSRFVCNVAISSCGSTMLARYGRLLRLPTPVGQSSMDGELLPNQSQLSGSRWPGSVGEARRTR